MSSAGAAGLVLRDLASVRLRSRGRTGAVAATVPRDALPLSDADVAVLICDGALAVRDGRRYVTGVLAAGALFADVRLPAGDGLLAGLSARGVHYVAGLPRGRAAGYARAAYAFHRLPRRAPSEAEVASYGVALEAVSGRLPGYTPELSADGYWQRWRHRRLDAHAWPRHKVYVSPLPCDLVEVLGAMARVCESLEVPALKVVRYPGEAVRADKLVAYCDDDAAAARLAREVSAALTGARVHGVPFAGQVDPSGLVGRAVDPGPEWVTAEPLSWRRLVARRIARSLGTDARGSVAERARFVYGRLLLDGIDPIAGRFTAPGAVAG